MKSTFIRLGLLALFLSALAGCGGDSGTATPAATTPGTTTPTPTVSACSTNDPAGTSVISLASFTTAQWASTKFNPQICSVTVASAPVVTFKVTDAAGNRIAGLGYTSQTAVQAYATYPNMAFNFGKLIPPSNGSPSKWVNLLVKGQPSICATTTTGYDPTKGCVVTGYGTYALGGTIPAVPGKPNTENFGTLVDNGDGTYKYTFRNDPTTIKAEVDALAASAVAANALNNVADLGDLSYQPTLTHRVGMVITGNARGTGNNNATANTALNGPAVALKNPTHSFYDFVPATGAVISQDETDGAKQRNIVNVNNCFQCHSKFTFHGGNAMTGTGGARQDTRMCVLCHTDQRKYATAITYMNASGSGFTTGAGNTSATPTTERMPNNGNYSIKTLPQWIHKIHMGEHLALTGYNTNIALEARFPQDPRNCTKCHDGSDTPATATKTPQGNNWYKAPSRIACGACHDGIDFNTGAGIRVADAIADEGNGKAVGTTKSGHGGGSQIDDSGCTLCHKVGGMQDIQIVHIAATPPNPNNNLNTMGTGNAATCNNEAVAASSVSAVACPAATASGLPAGNNANTAASWISVSQNQLLPNGATRATYDLRSVTVNASRQPVFTFRFLSSTATKDANNVVTMSTPAPVVFNTPPAAADATAELMTNFVGSTSVYFVGAMPQDGITSPADYNISASGYIKTIFNKTATGTGAGTFAGPVACPASAASVTETAKTADTGCYTVTLTGVSIPTSAVNMKGGLGYTYSTGTLPLTQTNVAGYPYFATADATHGAKTGGFSVPAPNASRPVTGQTDRRQAVEPARCNNCHSGIGVFMDSNFHAGQRNDSNTCAFCHTPNRVNAGWYVGSNSHIHMIHSAAKRNPTMTANAATGVRGLGVQGIDVPLTWATANAPNATTRSTGGFAEIGYPGVLRNCQQCHLPNTVNYGAATAFNNNQLLPPTAATGIINNTPGKIVQTYAYDATYAAANPGKCKPNAAGALAPQKNAAAYSTAAGSTINGVTTPGNLEVVADGVYNYGIAWSANVSLVATNACKPDGTLYTLAPGTSIEPDPTTLVHTPVTATCFACHVTTTARAHMTSNGGRIYATRASVLNSAGKFVNTEACLVCHGQGRVADVEVVHASTIQ